MGSGYSDQQGLREAMLGDWPVLLGPEEVAHPAHPLGVPSPTKQIPRKGQAALPGPL